jgi:hypothetical protein
MTPAEKILQEELRANKLGGTLLRLEFTLSLSKGTSPPNATMKSWDANGEFESSDLPTGCCARGDSAMGTHGRKRPCYSNKAD